MNPAKSVSATAQDVARKLGSVRNEIASLRAAIGSFSPSVVALKAEVDTTKKLCGVIEDYAKSKGINVSGIPPSEAIAVDANAGPENHSLSEEDFAERLKRAKTPAARKQVINEFEQSVRSGQLREHPERR